MTLKRYEMKDELRDQRSLRIAIIYKQKKRNENNKVKLKKWKVVVQIE